MATWRNLRERKGVGRGAKRLKNLTVDAAECAKIADMFAGGAAVASTSSVTAMLQQQQVEGEDSSSRVLTRKLRDRVSGKV